MGYRRMVGHNKWVTDAWSDIINRLQAHGRT